MDELIAELKKHIVDTLGLEDETPEDIETDAPLFGEGLGLDSIDALELVVMVEKQYGILLKDMETSKKAFASVRALAEFITEDRDRA
jgi:acyl carrier protein